MVATQGGVDLAVECMPLVEADIQTQGNAGFADAGQSGLPGLQPVYGLSAQWFLFGGQDLVSLDGAFRLPDELQIVPGRA